MKKILLLIALNSTIFANEADDKISYIFRNAKLSEALTFALEAGGKQVVDYKNIPDLTIKLIQGQKVSANELAQLLLKCGGLKLIPVDYYYKIVIDNKQNKQTEDIITTPFCNIFRN